MEVTFSSETSVDFQRTTQRHIPEDRMCLVNKIMNLRFLQNGRIFLASQELPLHLGTFIVMLLIYSITQII
jgi:hypothetical protein